METQSIVVLDFGSQYTQLIARRIREQNVFSVVLPCTASLEEVKEHNPAGIILSGGPCSVYDADAPPADERVLHLGVPVLGICYGLQFMTHKLGGKVVPGDKREYGHAKVDLLHADSALFKGLEGPLAVWMSHGDKAEELPPGFELIAKSENAVAAIQNPAKKYWAVQFHPEVHHTPQGTAILRNFIFDICGLDAELDAATLHRRDGRAHSRAGRQGPRHLRAVRRSRFVGRRRAGQPRHRRSAHLHLRQQRRAAQERVRQRAEEPARQAGPEHRRRRRHRALPQQARGRQRSRAKRKIIGNEFIAVFEEEAHRIEQLHGKVDWLVQGTLYPDVIESVSVRGPSQTIKSHHNVGGLPDVMKLKLIEPLRDLFKDEVRRIGRDLGMPEEILQRQPFPGPGLAVRILGEVTAERIALLQEADDIVVSEIKKAGLYTKIWQSFAVLLPVMSVGVMGDQRTYAYTCAIRAVNSEDGMTADWVPLPLRSAEDHLQPHRERGEGHQPRGLRHHVEAAGND